MRLSGSGLDFTLHNHSQTTERDLALPTSPPRHPRCLPPTYPGRAGKQIGLSSKRTGKWDEQKRPSTYAAAEPNAPHSAEHETPSPLPTQAPVEHTPIILLLAPPGTRADTLLLTPDFYFVHQHPADQKVFAAMALPQPTTGDTESRDSPGTSSPFSRAIPAVACPLMISVQLPMLTMVVDRKY
ncbi:hypothetical protein BASA60_009977 [Batrachochytrium salamandrivorans]|nr:hypothetical protein BASA60_009977 [Batrachochytrium salamandrivorans]